MCSMNNFNTYGTSLFLKSAGVDAHEEFIPLFWLPSLFHYCGALWELSHQLNQLGFRALHAAPLVFDGAHPCKVVTGQTLSQPGLELLLPPPAFISVQLSLCTQPKNRFKAPSFRAALRSVSQNLRTLGWNGHHEDICCSAPASFEGRSILKFNPMAQLLLQPSFQHLKAADSTALLHGKPLALGEVLPQLWAILLAVRGVHCLQPSLRCLSLLPYTDFLLTFTAPSLSRLPSPSPRDLVSSPWYSAAALARMALPHCVSAWNFTHYKVF